MSNVAEDRDLYSILSQIYAEDKRLDRELHGPDKNNDWDLFPDAIARQRKADADAAYGDIMYFPDVVTGYQQQKRKEAEKLNVNAILAQKEADKRKKKHNIKEGILLFILAAGILFGVSCAAFAWLFGLNTWKIAAVGLAATAAAEMGLMALE